MNVLLFLFQQIISIVLVLLILASQSNGNVMVKKIAQKVKMKSIVMLKTVNLGNLRFVIIMSSTFYVMLILIIVLKCATKKCIFASWKCDGDDDCNDGLRSDELNCSSTIRPYPVEPTTPSLPFITNVSNST